MQQRRIDIVANGVGETDRLPVGGKPTPIHGFLPGAIRLCRAPPQSGGVAIENGERILKTSWGDASHPVIERVRDNRLRLNSQ